MLNNPKGPPFPKHEQVNATVVTELAGLIFDVTLSDIDLKVTKISKVLADAKRHQFPEYE